MQRELDPLSLTTVLQVIRRRLLSILAWSFFAALAAAAWLTVPRPTFVSAATIDLGLSAASASSMLGDLGVLVGLGMSSATESEIVAIRSRSVAERTVSRPAGVPLATPLEAGYERHVGLATLVHDEDLSLLSVLRRRFLEPPPSRHSWVLPPSRLHAAIEIEDQDAPRVVRVRFLEGGRTRIETVTLLTRLGLGDAQGESYRKTSGSFAYRGLAIRLAPEGDFTGRSFILEHRPPFEAVDALIARTAAKETSRGSGVIRVTLADTDPRRAQETLAALCNNYRDSTKARSKRSPQMTVEFIRSILEEQRERFEQAQEEILAIQAEHPETLATMKVAEDIVVRLSGLEVERIRTTTARTALATIVAGLLEGDTAVLAGLDAESFPGPVGSLGLVVDPLTQGMVAEISRMAAAEARLGQQFQDEHPDLIALRGARAELLLEIRDQLNARSRNLDAELEALDQQRAELTDFLEELPESAARLARPLLAIEIHKEMLPFLVRSLQAAEISSTAADLSIDFIDPPSLPTELDSPNIPRGLFVGAFAGFLLGTLIAFFREPRAGSIRGLGDLSDGLELDILAVVPSFAPVPGALPEEESAADAYRHLRARLDGPKGEPRDGGRVLACIAAERGEGCSTTHVHLGIALARNGTRTVLVDADLRHPVLHEALGVEPGPGLSDVLRGELGWRDAVRQSTVPNLDLLTAGLELDRTGDLLSRPRMEALLGELAGDYDRVLLDLPPALGPPDVRALVGLIDDVVVLTRARRTTRGSLRDLLDLLAGAGVTPRGGVLNGARPASPRTT